MSRKPTQFFHNSRNSMTLRSGKTINGIVNSTLYKDFQTLFKRDNTGNTIQFGYCRTCFLVCSLFDFLEKYHKDIRGDYNSRIYGALLLEFYLMIRKKLKEYIKTIEDNTIDRCECNTQDYKLNGAIYRNINKMREISQQNEYSKMANYSGYGPERKKYRMYHLNFFIVEEELDGYYITRDYEKTKDELLHWLKYFNEEHQSTLDASEALLMLRRRSYYL